ncbi:hypothetical protein [Neobacillus sp. 114]|uniref:hypothetical protein n=1 Tax=Neobacillus sp. 114 TaxID=3048535 RepID=UPI0024C3D038|nr:hypothetical protein [Neobacillus sp. 114]
MLLKIGSLLLVLLITIYCIYHFYRNKDRFSGVIGIITALMIGISSAAIGFLLMLATNYQVLITTLICLVYTIGNGLLVRRLFPPEKGMNDILSGLIGALIGSVLGYSTFISNKPFLVIDIAFIVITYIALMYFDRQLASKSTENRSKKKNQKQASNVSTISLSAILIVIIVVLGLNVNQIKVGVIGQPQTQTASIDEENDMQVATIRVTASGFNPKNTTFQAHKMIKVNFEASIPKGTQIVLKSEDLKLNMNLKNGKNILLLDNPLEGKYQLTIEPTNATGTFTIKK